MTLIDASDLSSNWTAVAPRQQRSSRRGFTGMGGTPSDPFAVAGSYYWDPAAGDVDLGDLGGGAGANVFALTNAGVALGTSLSSDGTLHLFGVNPGVLAEPRWISAARVCTTATRALRR